MKLDQITKAAVAAGIITADKAPAFEAAILAADASMPGNVASSKEIEDKAMAAADAKRTARDKARDKARAAADAAVSPDGGAAGNADTSGNRGVRTDAHVVRHLDLVVQLDPVLDHGIV